MAPQLSVPGWHLLRDVRSDHASSQDEEPSVLFVRPLRPSRSPDSGHDLPQVAHASDNVVLRDLPHGANPLRYLRETDSAGNWRDIQNGVADVQADSLHAARGRTHWRQGTGRRSG